MIAILNNIRSLHNVGSIFRTADSVGIEKLYLCGITPSPVDRLGEVREPLAKVALGAEATVAWEKVKSVDGLIKRLRAQWYQIIALEQSPNSIPYYKFTGPRVVARGDRGDRIALIVGAEVEGLPPAVLKKCDKILEIPMSGAKESLNVSVAFGIVAFWLRDSGKIVTKSEARSTKQMKLKF